MGHPGHAVRDRLTRWTYAEQTPVEENPQLDAETVRHLRALGYIRGDSPGDDEG